MHVKSVLVSASVLAAALAAEARVWRVDPAGKGDFTAIQQAADVVQSGDEVIVAPGVYREEVRVARGGRSPWERITFRSERRGGAVVKGSEIWRNAWTPLAGSPDVFVSPIDDAQLAGASADPYRTTLSIGSSDKSRPARPMTNAVLTADTWCPRTLGQLFVDGEIVTETTSLASLRRSVNTWMVSHDGKSVWFHPARKQLPLADRLVEWTVRNRVFHAKRRGLSRITLDGFVFEHCANQGPFPQIGMVDVRSGGWRIENCTIRFAKTVGLAIGGETWDTGKLVDVPQADRRLMVGNCCFVRDCVISDCGVAGISGWSPGGATYILNNVIERNNRDDRNWPDKYWEEIAGIKFHGFHGVIAGNVIRDNEAHGIWLDMGFDDARITGNAILNNRKGGIMLEAAFAKAVVDDNLIGYSRPASGFYQGDGIYSHEGSCVTVAHNFFFYNAGSGVRFRTTWRGKTSADVPWQTSENRFLNNVFCMNALGALTIAGTNSLSRGCTSDGNLYIENEYPYEATAYPFRFANYNLGERKWCDLHAACAAAAGTNALPYRPWRGLGQPAMLEEWQCVQGMDAHSLVSRRGCMVQMVARDLTCSLQFDPASWKMRCPVVPGVWTDYFGNAYPKAGEVRPGPFQDASLLTTNGVQFAIAPHEWTGRPRLRKGWRDDESRDDGVFHDGETVVFYGDAVARQHAFSTPRMASFLRTAKPVKEFKWYDAGTNVFYATWRRPDVVVLTPPPGKDASAFAAERERILRALPETRIVDAAALPSLAAMPNAADGLDELLKRRETQERRLDAARKSSALENEIELLRRIDVEIAKAVK